MDLGSWSRYPLRVLESHGKDCARVIVLTQNVHQSRNKVVPVVLCSMPVTSKLRLRTRARWNSRDLRHRARVTFQPSGEVNWVTPGGSFPPFRLQLPMPLTMRKPTASQCRASLRRCYFNIEWTSSLLETSSRRRVLAEHG
jgi:hypothetical protein